MGTAKANCTLMVRSAYDCRLLSNIRTFTPREDPFGVLAHRLTCPEGSNFYLGFAPPHDFCDFANAQLLAFFEHHNGAVLRAERIQQFVRQNVSFAPLLGGSNDVLRC